MMFEAAHNRFDDAARRDERWWSAVRTGDTDTFEALFRAHAPDLCDFALSYVGSPDAAEEIVHELFCWIWDHRHTLENPRSVRGYLFAAVRNRAHNAIRDERTRASLLARLAAGDPAAIVGRVAPADARALTGDLRATVERAVVELPTRCREVFVLVRRHNASYAEAAAILGIAPKTVEIHMGRALKILRVKLAPWLDA